MLNQIITIKSKFKQYTHIRNNQRPPALKYVKLFQNHHSLTFPPASI